MSLVGTRPPTVDEWEKYELHHRSRMSIKPGITGMWQVSGRSDITDFEEVVKLDTEYIQNWTISAHLITTLSPIHLNLMWMNPTIRRFIWRVRRESGASRKTMDGLRMLRLVVMIPG